MKRIFILCVRLHYQQAKKLNFNRTEKLTLKVSIASTAIIAACLVIASCSKENGTKPITPPVNPPKTEEKPKVTYATNYLSVDSVITTLNPANNNLGTVKAVGRAQILNASTQGNGNMEIRNLNASSTGKAEIKVVNGYSYLIFPDLKTSGAATPTEIDKDKYTQLYIQYKTITGIDTNYVTTYALLNQKGAYLAIKDPMINTVDKFAAKMKSSTVLVNGLSANTAPGSENLTGPNAPTVGLGNGYTTITQDIRVDGGDFTTNASKIVIETFMSNAGGGGIQTSKGGNVKYRLVNAETGVVKNNGDVLIMTFPQNIDNNPANDVDPYVEYIATDEATKKINIYRLHLKRENGTSADLLLSNIAKIFNSPSETYNAQYIIQKIQGSDQKIEKLNIK